MEDQQTIGRIRQVKAKYEHTLLRKKNVVGVGIGYRQRGGQQTDEMALTVMVQHKQPRCELPAVDQIPEELEGVPVDVQEVGVFKAQ